MIITLNNHQVLRAINSLDVYSRIFIGQYREINWEIRFNAVDATDDWEKFEEKEAQREGILKAIRNIVIPDLEYLSFNASHGIWNFEQNDPRAIDAYDLQQAIRYKDAWHRLPEGGITRNFDKPWIRGRFPKPVIEITGGQDNYEMTIVLLPEQFQIMLEAANVLRYIHRGEFRKMFEVYTDNEEALRCAELLEKYIAECSPMVIECDDDYVNCLNHQSEVSEVNGNAV